MMDAPQKVDLWVPPRPAIIRAASLHDTAPYLAMPILTTFAAASARGVRPASMAATYRYFKLNVTAVDGGTLVGVDELKIYVGGTKHPNQTMTAPTAPSPLVASAGSNLSGNNREWRAFDDAVQGGGFVWYSSGGPPDWLKIDLGSGNGIAPTSFKITAPDTPNRAPKDFTVAGSNDDTNWTTLKTVTGETGWSASEERTFAL